MKDPEEEEINIHDKRFVEISKQMEQILNQKMEAFRHQYKRRISSRSSYGAGTVTTKVSYQKEEKSHEKSDWRRRSARAESNYGYYGRGDQRSKETAEQLHLRKQNEDDEVKRCVQDAFDAVEKIQKKRRATHQSVGTGATKERPSCPKKKLSIQEPEPN